jgi:hypothetical protein
MNILERNPWANWNRSCPPYILDTDREFVERHNATARREHRIMHGSIPEPFIGDPRTARVVLLGLNPGHKPEAELDHARPEIRKAMFDNLHHHGLQEYPFYPLNPTFAGTGVACWWHKHLRELKNEAGLDDQTLAKRLLVIEWFPYPSQRCKFQEPIGGSQDYCFQLAMHMLQKQGIEVIGMRSKKQWGKANEAFLQIPYLNSPQNPCLTKRNMDRSVYDRLLQALKRE